MCIPLLQKGHPGRLGFPTEPARPISGGLPPGLPMSGVHKGGFSKGGFSNSCVTIILLLLKPPFTKPPFVNSRCQWPGGKARWRLLLLARGTEHCKLYTIYDRLEY